MNIAIYQNKKIGISLSGGADSALLAFLLMTSYKDDLYFFTYASKEKNFRTVKNSSAVIAKCIEITGKINCYHHIKYDYSQERNKFLEYLVNCVDRKVIDLMYTGTTSAPPDKIQETFTEQLQTDIKARRSGNIRKNEWSHENKLFHPLINLNKKDIFDLYKKYNLLSNLYPLTNSCESLNQSSGHCGECWWCQERKWAFNEL